LVAVYSDQPGYPFNPKMEDVLTIAPPPGPEHLLDLVLHAVEHALDVHVDEERRPIDILLMQRQLLAVRPRVVEGDVQATEFAHSPLDQCLRLSGLAHIGRVEDSLTPALADGFDDPLAFRSVPAPDDDGGPGPRHRQ
jgi:hypothetical protein